MSFPLFLRRVPVVLALAAVVLVGGGVGVVLGVCGPFTDVAADAFCPFVLEIFTLRITTGTTPTTYDPASNVSRLQMAAFLSPSVDGILRRGSRHAALGRFWIPQSPVVLGQTTVVGSNPSFVKSDGADLWVTSFTGRPPTRRRSAPSRPGPARTRTASAATGSISGSP